MRAVKRGPSRDGFNQLNAEQVDVALRVEPDLVVDQFERHFRLDAGHEGPPRQEGRAATNFEPPQRSAGIGP